MSDQTEALFARASEAASAASVIGDLAVFEIAQARERLARAQAAAMGAEEAAGRAVAMIGIAIRCREAGDDDEALDQAAERAERARADATEALKTIRGELTCQWVPARRGDG